MGYIEENTKGRERLRAVVSSLSDEELSLQAGAGWTLAAILVHLAFWDFRVLALMQRWKNESVADRKTALEESLAGDEDDQPESDPQPMRPSELNPSSHLLFLSQDS